MSIQFGVCAVLLHGKVSEELFKKFDSAEITSLASQCIVEQLNEYMQPFKEGRQPARVEVTLSDGTKIKEELEDVPWLDAAAVTNRFQNEMSGLMDSAAIDNLLQAVQKLSSLKDCSQLSQMFKAGKPL